MPRSILIIDDEDHIREVASLSLEMTEHWLVTPASGGELGIELAKRHKPDAILLDVMMPGKDGPATFRDLQLDEATRDIPVIFLTAKVQGRDRQKLIELGVRGILAKPFDPLTLGQQVRQMLAWPAQDTSSAERSHHAA